jgi:ribosome recycling factor
MADEDVQLVLDEANESMDKALRALRSELQKVRTGRANPTLLQDVQVEYYGTMTPLQQLANLTAPEPSLIVVSPFDKGSLQAIERAIQSSDLGLTPNNDGRLIRIPIPPLTEERRKELIKVVRHEAEDARIAVRNIRRDANEHLKKLLKDHAVAEDDERHAQADVQKLTDRHIAEIDKVLATKETDLMAI